MPSGLPQSVLVPLLWSAAAEGALVKSIATARMAAVVDNVSAFASKSALIGWFCDFRLNPELAASRISAVSSGCTSGHLRTTPTLAIGVR